MPTLFVGHVSNVPQLAYLLAAVGLLAITETTVEGR